jgi:hypothetical protein
VGRGGGRGHARRAQRRAGPQCAREPRAGSADAGCGARAGRPTRPRGFQHPPTLLQALARAKHQRETQLYRLLDAYSKSSTGREKYLLAQVDEMHERALQVLSVFLFVCLGVSSRSRGRRPKCLSEYLALPRVGQPSSSACTWHAPQVAGELKRREDAHASALVRAQHELESVALEKDKQALALSRHVARLNAALGELAGWARNESLSEYARAMSSWAELQLDLVSAAQREHALQEEVERLCQQLSTTASACYAQRVEQERDFGAKLAELQQLNVELANALAAEQQARAKEQRAARAREKEATRRLDEVVSPFAFAHIPVRPPPVQAASVAQDAQHTQALLAKHVSQETLSAELKLQQAAEHTALLEQKVVALQTHAAELAAAAEAREKKLLGEIQAVQHDYKALYLLKGVEVRELHQSAQRQVEPAETRQRQRQRQRQPARFHLGVFY